MGAFDTAVADRVQRLQAGWRKRFLDLVDGLQPLCLSDQQGLPRWLQNSGSDPWERGNRWVLEMAQASGARKLTLIALWDRGPADGPGGTQDMVETAQARGAKIVVLDTRALFAR